MKTDSCHTKLSGSSQPFLSDEREFPAPLFSAEQKLEIPLADLLLHDICGFPRKGKVASSSQTRRCAESPAGPVRRDRQVARRA